MAPSSEEALPAPFLLPPPSKPLCWGSIGTAQVTSVPALGQILPRDGRGAAQHRGPEQAGGLQLVFVNIDLQ